MSAEEDVAFGKHVDESAAVHNEDCNAQCFEAGFAAGRAAAAVDRNAPGEVARDAFYPTEPYRLPAERYDPPTPPPPGKVWKP